MFGPVLEVLDDLVEHADEPNCLFIKKALGITNELSQTLQRKEQDIMNVMSLIVIAKACL